MVIISLKTEEDIILKARFFVVRQAYNNESRVDDPRPWYWEFGNCSLSEQ
jgi:hypothetical protein